MSDQMTIKEFAKHQAKYVRKNNRDMVIAVTGYEGFGKSSFSAEFGFEADPNFDLVKNVLYTPDADSTRDKIVNLPKFSVVDVDEALKILHKQNRFDKSQKYINDVYGLGRKENKISLLNMPLFVDFNKYFREHRIFYWVYILEQGVGVIFAKDWSPFAKDPWWIDENMRIMKKARGRRGITTFSTEERLNILSKSLNYVGHIFFDPLKPEIEARYQELRDADVNRYENSYNNIEEEVGIRDQRRIEGLVKSVDFIKAGNPEMSIEEICNEIGFKIAVYYLWKRKLASKPLYTD